MCIDYNNDDWKVEDDWEPTPEEVREIKRAAQDLNDGFGYEWVKDDEEFFTMKCMKCGRKAEITERPFPHKYDCPMRRYSEEKDW